MAIAGRNFPHATGGRNSPRRRIQTNDDNPNDAQRSGEHFILSSSCAHNRKFWRESGGATHPVPTSTPNSYFKFAIMSSIFHPKLFVAVFFAASLVVARAENSSVDQLI